MSCSDATTSFRSDSTRGLARPLGTGVTRPTQCDDSCGVSTGTRSSKRGGSPATAAYRRIMSA